MGWHNRFRSVLATQTVLADPSRVCSAARRLAREVGASRRPLTTSANHVIRRLIQVHQSQLGPSHCTGLAFAGRRACSANSPSHPRTKSGGRHFSTVIALRHGVAMRGAEQRSKRGRGPRGLSEGEQKRNHLRDINSSPSSAAARVCEQRREPRQTYRRGGEPGVAFFGLPFLAKQER